MVTIVGEEEEEGEGLCFPTGGDGGFQRWRAATNHRLRDLVQRTCPVDGQPCRVTLTPLQHHQLVDGGRDGGRGSGGGG